MAETPAMSPVYYMMETALDKLKCLNYERDYILPTNRKPITREHFVLPGSNPSLQFQEFLDLVVWLMSTIKRDADFFKVDKYDDPITSVNKMLLALRSLAFDAEFPAAKLKQAHGEAVCTVLDFLTDQALVATKFTFKVPKHNDLAELNGEIDDTEGEADDDEIEDEIEIADDIENNAYGDKGPRSDEEPSHANDAANQIIESRVNPIEWKTELERVGPRLRTNTTTVGKEWRSHIDQTKKHEMTIRNELPGTESTLQLINSQLEGAVEKVKSKEKYVNSQYASLATEYQKIRESLKEVEELYQGSSSNVSTLTNELATIADQLSDIKNTMDSRGSSMTDTSPLVKIKSALQEIKVEINHFELRIGVVGHTLLQAQSTNVNVKGGYENAVTDEEDL